MTSNSQKSEMVRQYFITIEEAYREYLTGEIKNRLRVDKVDYYDKYPKNKQIKYPRGPSIYVIKNVDRGHIRYRIGETDNLNRRLGEHRREIPGQVDLVLFEMYKNNDFLESCIHTFLKDSRVSGVYSLKNQEMTEIFESDIPKILRIINVCKMFRQSSDVGLYIKGDESYSTISDMFTSDESGSQSDNEK